MNDFIILAVIFTVSFNIYVTVRLYCNAGYSKNQKLAQCVLVWFMPVLGALLIALFINDDEKPKGPDKSGFGGGSAGGPST